MILNEKTQESIRGAREELLAERGKIDETLALLDKLYPPALGPETRAALNSQGAKPSRGTKPKRKYKKRLAPSPRPSPLRRGEGETDSAPAAADGWMTVGEIASKLKLTDDVGLGWQLKKLINGGSIESNGKRARAVRYRIIKEFPATAPVRTGKSETARPLAERADGSPRTARASGATVLDLAKEFVAGATERFTRDQVEAYVKSKREDWNPDHASQIGIWLSQQADTNQLQRSGYGRMAIYGKA